MVQRDTSATLSLDRYAKRAKVLVAGAQSVADERRHAEVQPLHLLACALSRDPGVVEVFRRAGTNVVELQSAVERSLNTLPKATESAYLSLAMLDLLERAEREAERERSGEVLVEHLLNALSQEIRGPAGELLGSFRVSPGSLRAHTGALKQVPSTAWAADTSSPERFTRDLVAEARSEGFDPVIGRVLEMRRLMTILERREKNHPLLVGEPGVGKSAVVRGLASRLSRNEVPANLKNTRLHELETGALMAGARLRGEMEERVRSLVANLSSGNGDSVLVVKNLDQLFGAGPAGSVLGDLLRPSLHRGELRLLGTVTPDGLKRLEERDPQFVRTLTVLPVEEPSLTEALDIVRGLAGRYEAHHQVNISESAVSAAVRLAKRYLQHRFLPDSAIDLLDEAAATQRIETDGTPAELDQALSRAQAIRAQLESLGGAQDQPSLEMCQKLNAEFRDLEPRIDQLRGGLESRKGAGGGRPLGEPEVAQTLAGWTGIPVAKMLEGEAEKLLKMEQRLGERVIGQTDAVSAIARAVRRGRVGLRDPKKPIGSFLFLGPSGVGKTELAKALAQFLFDDPQALTRLDMSEFMERHMAARLIGAPPGYADSEQGGFLTEAVRRRPYSVLLFDEVEKAHQDVFNLLLQVLDDGRLTDGRGRLADFSNTVVIMTSNTGSERILETDARAFETEEGREALREVLLDRLHQFFRPEFLNRIDDVVVFRPLAPEHLRSIVDIQIQRLDELLADRRVRLVLEDAARERLAQLGYEPALGARPLQRAILKHIQDPLAEALLSGEYATGTTILVRLVEEKFVFESQKIA